MNINGLAINVCACMGPRGNDPHCPCRMRQMELEPTPAFNFNLERMERALASPVTVMPRGLSREEKHRFLMGADHIADGLGGSHG